MDYDRFNIHCPHCGAYHDDPRRCPNCGERVPREEVEAPSQRDYHGRDRGHNPYAAPYRDRENDSYGRGAGYYPYAPSHRDREYGSYGDESSPVKKGIAIGVVALLIVAILGVGVYFGFVKDGGIITNYVSELLGITKVDNSKLISAAVSNKAAQELALEIPDSALEFCNKELNLDICREDFINFFTIASSKKCEDEYRGFIEHEEYYDMVGYVSEDFGKYLKQNKVKTSSLSSLDSNDYRSLLYDLKQKKESELNGYYLLSGGVETSEEASEVYWKIITEMGQQYEPNYNPKTDKPIEIKGDEYHGYLYISKTCFMDVYDSEDYPITAGFYKDGYLYGIQIVSVRYLIKNVEESESSGGNVNVNVTEVQHDTLYIVQRFDEYIVTGVKDNSITSVTIPDYVTSICWGAFSDCSGLTAVYITDLAKWCNIDFGDSYSNPLYYAHNLYLNGELVTDLVIPDSEEIHNLHPTNNYGVLC